MDLRPLARALPAALVAAAFLSPGRAAGDTQSLAEGVFEDTSVGYAVRPIRGWEPRPRKNPDDPVERVMAGGWYMRPNPKKRDETDGVECLVLRFGSYFEDGDRAVATGPVEGKKEGEGGDEGKPEGGGGEGKPEGGGGEEGKPETEAPRTVKEMFGKGPASFDEWFENWAKWQRTRGLYVDLKPRPAKMGDDEGRLWEGVVAQGPHKFQVIGASVRRGPFEVAILYFAPDGKWFARDYKSAFSSSAKSLRILPEKTMRRAREALEKKLKGADPEAAFVEKAIAGLPPGWKHHRTDHYVIVYDKTVDFTNPGLVRRIANQLELIRANVYEKLFPAARPITALSIVKVTQDPKQYEAYGAPAGSAGYWSWPSRELVFFCQKENTDVTLDVLNHEAFHQYIFYAVGQVAPHSWYNEGHGDYFAGFNLKEGKFTSGKFHWRQEKVKRAIESKTYVPLKDFLSFDQNKYYGRFGGDDRSGGNIGQNYAQGWSLVWFLRTTKDEKYAGVLDRYFDTIKAEVGAWRTKEEEQAAAEERAPAELIPPKVNQDACEAALKAAFGAIDVEQLEKDWIASKPY
jgi:hypothetical protein